VEARDVEAAESDPEEGLPKEWVSDSGNSGVIWATW
jgi:hypothetical protein